jgi:hypothetical protein
MDMKTIKITSTRNGVVTGVREYPINDDAFERFSNNIKEMKKRKEERMKNHFPPKEISDFINKKTEDTYTLNKGNLDTQSFRLGMYSMWHFLKKKTNE